MANKIERLMFTRKRLILDIKHQANIIELFETNTSAVVLLSRKEALEELWSDFRVNTQEIENARDWVGTEEFIVQGSETRELYLKALVTITELLPEDASKHQQSLTMFQQRLNTASESNDEEAHTRNLNEMRSTPTLEHDIRLNEHDGETSRRQSHTLHSSTLASSHHQQTIGLPATIKLPPLTVKPFTGNPIDWPEFQATCEGTFTNIMNEFSRFQYLKGYLKGDPARMVQHLPLTGTGSYDRAIEILKKRYDNPRAIINANLKRLFDLTTPSTESTEVLKTMLDTLNECLSTLTGYGINTDTWNSILIFVLSQRLDPNSIQYWEERIQGQRTVPSLSQFIEFLEIRINVLETTSSTRALIGRASVGTQNKIITQPRRTLIATTNTKRCTICKQDHFAFRCSQLLNIPIEDRMQFVQDRGLCINCLFSHRVEDCKSRFSCRHCNERHNSVIHPPVQIHNLITTEENQDEEINLEPEELQALEMEGELIAHVANNSTLGDVKLATAIVRIEHNNQCVYARALIDQGATANLISKRILNILCAPKERVGIPITGVCEKISYTVNTKTIVKIRPHNSNSSYVLELPALVVPRITTISESSDEKQWQHLENLELADPDWQKSGRIDILLGSATHAEIILNGLKKGQSGQPIAQKTELGWIVSGGNGGQRNIRSIFTLKVTNEDLSKNLQRFWESEEIPEKPIFTADEQMAEDIFVKTTKRCSDGRIMVKLPFKNNAPSLGDSKFIAKRRYDSTTKRLSAQPDLKETYDASIQEYLDLGQMELADESIWPHSYLPHHPIIKESSTTTKVRVVYDASCKTGNGNSLNSQLLVGPTIQSDLFSLLINWRKGRYAFTGEIEKMYRQIWIDPVHTEFQRILWQAPGSSEIKSYKLKTVTFGVASAPFLAIRTLFLIAEDIQNDDPEMADKIKYQFYVDDFFDSVDSIQEAQQTIKNITSKLAEYGFLLRKFKANNEAILNELSDSEKDASPSNVFKTLGIQWHQNTDEFLFVSAELKSVREWTKRTILSDISRLFDPLGWLSPCIIIVKIFMQKLWMIQANWDDQLSTDMVNEWLHIRQQFITSCAVKIPRWIGFANDSKHVSLQGFCDASERAIAGVVFIRIQNSGDTVSCRMIAAKTRVAPLKKTSIPRLELNAAVL